MRTASAGQFWLTLFVLIATFSSKPFGSMEQGVPEANRSFATADLLPATRLITEPDAVESAVEPTESNPRRFLQHFALAPLTSRLSALHVRVLTGGGLTHTSSDKSVPLCERLPYDANAPPVVA